MEPKNQLPSFPLVSPNWFRSIWVCWAHLSLGLSPGDISSATYTAMNLKQQNTRLWGRGGGGAHFLWEGPTSACRLPERSTRSAPALTHGALFQRDSACAFPASWFAHRFPHSCSPVSRYSMSNWVQWLGILVHGLGWARNTTWFHFSEWIVAPCLPRVLGISIFVIISTSSSRPKSSFSRLSEPEHVTCVVQSVIPYVCPPFASSSCVR